MTMLKPTLEIKKLIVSAGGDTAFDADFHSGLNIIRGENSSGKSTIMDFLFYGLGGDLNHWREAALDCEEVTIEVLLNGHAATLKRDIKGSKYQPMRIFPGPFAEADKSATKGWSVYPYKRTSQKESFSQIIFRWLDLPQVPGHETSNITMHQLLRVLYSDQVTPIDHIFRAEQFDTALTRQTVGDLLCGAYHNELFEAQISLRDAKKNLDAYSAELSSIFSTLGTVQHSLTMDWVAAERKSIHAEIASIQQGIIALEERIFHGEVSDGLSLQSQQKAYEEVCKLQDGLARQQEERDELQLEIADSDLFIRSLMEKKSALQDASLTAETLKSISFLYCPACFAPIESSDSEHHCHLCKAPFDQDRAQSRILLLINDVGLQLKQSSQLQEGRVERMQAIEREFAHAKSLWEAASGRYKLVNRLPSTELRTRVRELHRKAGYLDRQLENLNEKAELVERIDALSQKKAEVQSEISRLGDYILACEAAQDKQLRKSYTAIAEDVKWLLKRDLARQDTFEKAERIDFSFERDRVSVNGESFFSASSMVYLRNSFLVGFWKASLKDESFRFPRFLMMDTIEDKGMEPTRSHNFQNLLMEISESAEVDHQLIYATSMISPELENSNRVVGRFYTHDERTLALPRNP